MENNFFTNTVTTPRPDVGLFITLTGLLGAPFQGVRQQNDYSPPYSAMGKNLRVYTPTITFVLMVLSY